MMSYPYIFDFPISMADHSADLFFRRSLAVLSALSSHRRRLCSPIIDGFLSLSLVLDVGAGNLCCSRTNIFATQISKSSFFHRQLACRTKDSLHPPTSGPPPPNFSSLSPLPLLAFGWLLAPSDHRPSATLLSLSSYLLNNFFGDILRTHSGLVGKTPEGAWVTGHA